MASLIAVCGTEAWDKTDMTTAIDNVNIKKTLYI
jgi:hypothetical protein